MRHTSGPSHIPVARFIAAAVAIGCGVAGCSAAEGPREPSSSAADALRLVDTTSTSGTSAAGAVFIVTRSLPPGGGFNGKDCSGVALSPRVILTIASCLQGANDFNVVGGPAATAVHTFDYPLGAAPSFNAPNPTLHDIAVLILPTDYQPLSFLGTPGSFPDIATALPPGATINFKGQLASYEDPCDLSIANCNKFSVPLPVVGTGTNGFLYDYELPPGPSGLAIAQPLVNVLPVNFVPKYETDLGRGVYIAGTSTLVGLNSAVVGTATYVARTDVVRSWLLNEIAAATPPPPPPPGYSTTAHLANLSTRLYVGTGNDVGITGFVIAGSGSKKVVLRALGPSLTPYGVPGALANPTIELRNSAGAVVAFNDDWQTDPQAATLIASGRAPADPLEAALAIDLPPGAYTAIVSGVAAQSGVALVELYDQEPGVGPRRLINASTRGKVLDGAAVMIAGFVVEGTQPLNVMMRGLGPTLSTSGIVDYLRNPTLELHAANGSLVATNDTWSNSANKDAIIATGLAPPGYYESAILKSLAPGAYTVILRGGPDLPPPYNTGVGLVEVFEVPTR